MLQLFFGFLASKYSGNNSRHYAGKKELLSEDAEREYVSGLQMKWNWLKPLVSCRKL